MNCMLFNLLLRMRLNFLLYLLGGVTMAHGFLSTFNGKGLDINCWTGESTKALQEKFPDIEWKGMDYRTTVINVANKRYSKMEFIKEDFEKTIPSSKETFCLIQISKYKDLSLLMDRVWPLLEDDGLLIVHFKKNDRPILKQKEARFDAKHFMIFEDRSSCLIMK